MSKRQAVSLEVIVLPEECGVLCFTERLTFATRTAGLTKTALDPKSIP